MSVTGTHAERIAAERARVVAPGVATPKLVVASAEGSRITDVDGRSFIDFGGGIGCQNTGHRHPAVVEAIKEQADRYLHQCFMVGMYEPYVELCTPARRSLARAARASSAPIARQHRCRGRRERGQDRAQSLRAARPSSCSTDAFHGRTLLAMTMTSKVKPYKAGFGPFAPEVYRAPAPYPYHGITSDDAIAALEHLFKADVDPSTVACVVLEPVQGEGGFVTMPRDYLLRLQELCRSHGILYVDDEVQSGVGRTGTMWAVEQHEGVEPDMVTFGKSIGGGLPLAGVTGKAEVMDAVPPGGLGGTFGGNPVSCAAGLAVLDVLEAPGFLDEATKLGETLRARLDAMAAARPEIGEVRGLGAMLAFEFAERTPDRAQAVVAAAAERGLLLLSCGLYGNVIRLLPPLNIPSDDLDEGLGILEESLGA